MNNINELTRKHTAFNSFEDMLNAPGYIPSFDVSSSEVRYLANKYDYYATGKKCFRYGFESATWQTIHVSSTLKTLCKKIQRYFMLYGNTIKWNISDDLTVTTDKGNRLHSDYRVIARDDRFYFEMMVG